MTSIREFNGGHTVVRHANGVGEPVVQLLDPKGNAICSWFHGESIVEISLLRGENGNNELIRVGQDIPILKFYCPPAIVWKAGLHDEIVCRRIAPAKPTVAAVVQPSSASIATIDDELDTYYA